MRQCDPQLDSYWGTICTPLELLAPDGKMRETDLGLIFNMLGEAATTEITRNRNAQGFIENKDTARRGGKIAGDARKKLEKESGRKVITSENYLEQPEVAKRIGKKQMNKHTKHYNQMIVPIVQEVRVLDADES